MSDQILHECGIAMIRLRKPLSYYIEKYGPTYAMNKMYITFGDEYRAYMARTYRLIPGIY